MAKRLQKQAKEKEQKGHFYQSPTAKDKAPVVILVPERDKCFDTESTAQHHAQMGGYQVGSEFIGDWIVDNL